MLVLERSAAPTGLNFAADCYIAYDNSKQLKSEPDDSLFWQNDEHTDERDSAQVTQKAGKSIF